MRTNVSDVLPATTNASMGFLTLKTDGRWSCTEKDVLTDATDAVTCVRKVQSFILENMSNTSNAAAIVENNK